MSTTIEQPNFEIIRERSQEIIDVDDWIRNTGDFQHTRGRDFRFVRRNTAGAGNGLQERPRIRRRLENIDAAVIVLDDSDDEDIEVLEGPSRAVDANRPLFRRRRGPYFAAHRDFLSPPPPPPPPEVVPPVPTVNRFSIRNLLNGITGQQQQNEQPAAAGPIPAHEHGRNEGQGRGMGLGGALLARPHTNNHLNAQQQHQHQQHQHQQHQHQPLPPPPPPLQLQIRPSNMQRHFDYFRANAPNFRGLFLGNGNNINNPNNANADGARGDREPFDLRAGSAEEEEFIRIALDPDRRNHFEPRAWVGGGGFPHFLGDFHGGMDRILQRAAPDYKQSYTHPSRPVSGFTFDFAPPESSTTSYSSPITRSAHTGNAETGTILVCGKCMAPLVMNVAGGEEEVRHRKIWGLRCGHVIDGECIDTIMKPAPPPEQDDLDRIIEIASSDPPEILEDSEKIMLTKRDKGKAKALPEEEKPIVIQSSSPIHAITPSTFHYNLRSHPLHSASTSTSCNVQTAHVRPSPPEVPLPAPTHRGRGRRARGRGSRGGRRDYKGKARAAQPPVVEEEYEWFCPVTGCGQLHLSMKIGGVWKMDDRKDLGAIPLYV